MFSTHYRLRRSGGQCISEVTALQERRLLELTHKSVSGWPETGPQNGMRAVERITLEERGGVTEVLKVVRVWNHGIPWIFLPLIWLITHFGRPANPSPLIELLRAGKNAG